ncbi:MAG TPA: hypothetical protein VEW74_05170, partial [Candidatus Nitrosotalea sp.]|nr:hypothetical protein [Candidatus Nitrosotalea sp.]
GVRVDLADPADPEGRAALAGLVVLVVLVVRVDPVGREVPAIGQAVAAATISGTVTGIRLSITPAAADTTDGTAA